MRSLMIQSQKILRHFSTVAMFFFGVIITFLVSGTVFVGLFYWNFSSRIHPNVRIANIDVSAMTTTEAYQAVRNRFPTQLIKWNFTWEDSSWSIESGPNDVTLNTREIVDQAFGIGRKSNPYESILEIWNSYLYGKNLNPKVIVNPTFTDRLISQIRSTTDYPPVDAQFKFEPQIGPDKKGRVVVFVQSKNGQNLDITNLKKDIEQSALIAMSSNQGNTTNVAIKTISTKPTTSSDEVNKLGIVSNLGRGESYFYDSIPERMYNIALGTEKINGSLIAPGETFSFDQAIGTVSAVFGFKKAYAIKEGKTVLDDGGGVCQVSTTLYRAVLNAGLPVVEREAHSYRVGFYEQGGFLPGMDATVYPPSPDFKFTNDTGNWILLQATMDKSLSKLTFDLYGTSDGRVSKVSKPVILSTTPPPEPIYEDDPTLQSGVVKQVDTAHAGAKVYFTRIVTRNGETLIDERINTNYIPWPARYLRGTKT